MATVTPNFGWDVPQSTDLVKDGATAIAALGNDIDTSLVDLKGGTTGQVLSKASNSDMDFTWVAQDDSNAIQNALLTTTGDTIYASSASTPARLGIGTTGQVLTVSGGIPAWTTISSGSQTELATGSLSGTAVNITSINQTYKDLRLYLYDYTNSSTGGAGMGLRINNLSTGIYDQTGVRNGTAFVSNTGSNLTLTSPINTNPEAVAMFEFQEYTNTTASKKGYYYAHHNDYSGSPWMQFLAFAVQTTGALTEINLFVSSGTFASGTYRLVGIK